MTEISKITQERSGGHVSEVSIWFGGEGALRYVWDEERGEIREQTYLDGVVHDGYGIGGDPDDVREYAFETVVEYVNSYRDDKDALRNDWPHVAELIEAVEE